MSTVQQCNSPCLNTQINTLVKLASPLPGGQYIDPRFQRDPRNQIVPCPTCPPSYFTPIGGKYTSHVTPLPAWSGVSDEGKWPADQLNTITGLSARHRHK